MHMQDGRLLLPSIGLSRMRKMDAIYRKAIGMGGMILLCGLCAAEAKAWPPTQVEVPGRTTEVFRHGSNEEWGYSRPQDDTFVVVHPKVARTNAPLYVVLHSAGHDVWSAIKCTAQVGDHDIYHPPEGFYALYLDCRANRGDWWWGGTNPRDAGAKKSGGELQPVERRVIGTVKWVMEKYGIDPNRVYLCGNSMGGSGALGIGLRHGDLFAAVKANVPAGIEHVSDRLFFPPAEVPEAVQLSDPPVVVDYSAPNDDWSVGHGRFVKAMNDRKLPLYFYWGPFGHANNDARILAVNDLVHSFDWLSVKKNEAYAVFSNASCNDPLPWPDNLSSTVAGQVNAFFRWKNMADTESRFEMQLHLVSENDLTTSFAIPTSATADVSLRRLQQFEVEPGQRVQWQFGKAGGEVVADDDGLITIPGLTLTDVPETLTINRL